MLKVSVKDTGIGIRKCDQIKLFTLFGRIGNSNNLNRGGIGLGLNICKQIVQAFEGSIHIESEIHKGSKFTFFWKVEDLSNDNFLTERVEMNRPLTENEGKSSQTSNSERVNVSYLSDLDSMRQSDERVKMELQMPHTKTIFDINSNLKKTRHSNGFKSQRLMMNPEPLE